MFRIEAIAEDAVSVELRGSRSDAGRLATHLARELRTRSLADGAVSGTRSVLLTEPRLRGNDLQAAIEDALAAEHDPGTVLEHEISVRYDGADLTSIARSLGLTVEDVVEMHSEPLYEVSFIGFQPGFPYMSGLHRSLRTVERLASPRVSVPAGSVAIAAGWAGVYPLEGPAGWQIVGTTHESLFDPTRENPVLLSPGDRVRFRPA
jgi:KipI family sensor histidine kinase inhibitor